MSSLKQSADNERHVMEFSGNISETITTAKAWACTLPKDASRDLRLLAGSILFFAGMYEKSKHVPYVAIVAMIMHEACELEIGEFETKSAHDEPHSNLDDIVNDIIKEAFPDTADVIALLRKLMD